jgi:hypothetical protein
MIGRHKQSIMAWQETDDVERDPTTNTMNVCRLPERHILRRTV